MIISKAIIPSSSHLQRMILTAEAKFEADREQRLLAKDARENDRIARAWCAEVEAKRRARYR